MRLSLQLLAERLSQRGNPAFAVNSEGWSCERMRLLPPDGEPLIEGTLYACNRLPEGPSARGDVSYASCAFALTGSQQLGRLEPCLLVENASDAGDLLNLIADVHDELAGAVARARELIWEDNGITSIVEILSDLIGNPVYIVDSSLDRKSVV